MTGSFLRTYNLASYVTSKAPNFTKLILPIASFLIETGGYRKLGLRYDDLHAEENPIIKKAINRLEPKEYYDRVFRIRRAHQLSLQHQLLPKDQQLKPEEDIRYLTPYILEAEAEARERQYFDNLTVISKK
ncbi:ubiquinol-cytochrome C reductase complex 14kD subunit-domain-containing protein [Lipomyces japonicus]|uniref:ubiquinol-cytochrome C reductase complex 14kD subunit-domain-containing protein n=1 Tax=Lipomyces japonicus TaxID=56871 RepID=UPI0034CFA7CE